jgi:histidinol-phosphate aminotransferase
MIEFRNCLSDILPYVPGRPIEEVVKDFGLSKVVKLASNENPLGCSPKALEALKNVSPELYPDGNCSALREKLAAKLGIGENQLVFGAGSDELITLVAKAVINPGDECLTGEISFPQYSAAVRVMDGVVNFVKMPGYAYDLYEILYRVTSKTKLIYIANPNNPTGTAFYREEQERFLKSVPSDVLVVLDEAYSEYFGYSSEEAVSRYENLIVLKTFSKAYGLASLRIGYGISNENIISELEKIRNPFNVTSYAQAAALAALDDQDFIDKSVSLNKASMEFICGRLEQMGIKYIPSLTNFVAIESPIDAKLAFTRLLQKGFIVRPAFENTLRVTIGKIEDMKELLFILGTF